VVGAPTRSRGIVYSTSTTADCGPTVIADTLAVLATAPAEKEFFWHSKQS
jgi:hypothetical protein